MDANEDHGATTRGSSYAGTIGTAIIEEKTEDQCLTNTTFVVVLLYDNCFLRLHFRQTVRPTVVVSNRPAALTHLERVELDERVSEESQLNVAVEDSRTAQYAVGRDNAAARGRGFVSTGGTHTQEIEKSGSQSLHGDMVHIRSMKTDVFGDTNVSRPASWEPRWAFCYFV